MANILVIIEKGPTSYGAYSPDVPGCVAVGDTRDEVEAYAGSATESPSTHARRASSIAYIQNGGRVPGYSAFGLATAWEE